MIGSSKRGFLLVLIFTAACGRSAPTETAAPPVTVAPTDPLPSWNDGSSKRAILDFVARVTKESGPEFVPVPERIATFDNDGTLWAEKPVPFSSSSPSIG